MVSRFGLWFTVGVFGLNIVTSGLGCNKAASSGPGNEFFVVIGPPDMNGETGTLSDAGLAKIKEASGQSNVTIRMSGHAELSDAGLAQLAQFKNIHRVLAPSSRITPAGIDKLKKANPGVVVEK